VNGREMTADDVVYSLTRLKGSEYAKSVGYDLMTKSITKIDNYTVQWQFDLSQYYYGSWHGIMAVGNTWIIPKEVVTQYGDLTKPLTHVGSGPYIIKDYVPGSSYKFDKNPSYWEKDPRYPNNSLPYIDTVKFLIIADTSTRMAGLRTGKIDMTVDNTTLVPSDAETLINSAPQLKYREVMSETRGGISCRVDVKPLDNIKVRQAISMCIDRQNIIDKYYKGHSTRETMPANPGWPEYFIPYEQWPADLTEIYSFNTAKAKQMIIDAGYPNGFDWEVTIANNAPDTIQVLQLMVNWMAQANIRMNLKVMDYSPYITQRYAHTFAMSSAGAAGIAHPYFAITYWYQPPDGSFWVYNLSKVNDPVYNKMRDEFFAGYAQTTAERKAKYDEIYIYMLRQCWSVGYPYPNTFAFWQPWITGGFYGQAGMTYTGSGDLYKYICIDQDMKYDMTGSR